MAHFQIKDLIFSYPTSKGKKSLDGVSLSIEKGEYIVLCGKSGSGKTTLLRQMKSVLAPHGKKSGEILFGGVPLEKVSQRDQAFKIGYVMQNPDDQIVTDKVWHELAFGLESLGCDQKTMRARVAEMACYFGIADWFHRDVANLSGGQKQLLNLASIMAMQPEVLILDEPTSQLDPIAASDFLNTVRKINIELGTTVIITEHRLEDIFPYADRAIVMDGGRVIADDTPRNIGRLLYEQNNDMFAAMPTPVRVFYGAGGDGDCPLTVREGRNWLSKEFSAKLASSFGGGMGRMREVCGAVSGMLMVAGHLYGYDAPDPAAQMQHYALVQELAGKFREAAGSIICREILKNPPSDPKPTPRTAEFYKQRPCARLVVLAAQILDEYIKNHPL